MLPKQEDKQWCTSLITIASTHDKESHLLLQTPNIGKFNSVVPNSTKCTPPKKKKNETIDLNKNPNQYYYRHHENHNIHQVKNSL